MPTVRESAESRKARQEQRVESATRRIVDRFERGNLPEALAPIFIKHADDMPCRRWSWSNQLLTALAGYDDARTYKDWQKVGRQVRKGEKGFHILELVTVKKNETDRETGEERDTYRAVGIKAGARFRSEDLRGMKEQMSDDHGAAIIRVDMDDVMPGRVPRSRLDAHVAGDSSIGIVDKPFGA